MRIFRVCWSMLLLAILAHPAFPGIRASFSLDYSAWDATHIVLVITTPNDDTFEVVESWKGDLRVGERLVVPELIPASNAAPISRYPKSWSAEIRGGVSELIPRQPVGSRMVLFLKSTNGQVPTERTNAPEHYGWQTANRMGSMKASTVWMDSDQLYCFTQLINPGLSVLHSMSPYSEGELRSRVVEIKGIQEKVTAALATKDGEGRAELLKPYVRSDVFPARQFALEELGKSGLSAVPTIRAMLDDPAFADEAPELVIAIAKAGGEEVGGELNRRLQLDLAFWRSTGPSLSQGWWNENSTPHAPLRERYGETYQLILGLQQIHYPGALNTAMQLRDFWRSLPQLNDPSGLSQIAEECDKLIAQLQGK
jgi:hypothetical protein